MVRNGETVRCETFRFVVVLKKRNDVSEYKRGVALSGGELRPFSFSLRVLPREAKVWPVKPKC